MANDETRMTNDEGIPKSEFRTERNGSGTRWFGFRAFGLLSSFVIRHSSFALDNDEARMTNAEGIPKSKCPTERNNSRPAVSDFEDSGFIRHLSFVIRIWAYALDSISRK